MEFTTAIIGIATYTIASFGIVIGVLCVKEFIIFKMKKPERIKVNVPINMQRK